MSLYSVIKQRYVKLYGNSRFISMDEYKGSDERQVYANDPDEGNKKHMFRVFVQDSGGYYKIKGIGTIKQVGCHP